MQGMAEIMKDIGCRPARREPHARGRRRISFNGRTRGPRTQAYGFFEISMKRLICTEGTASHRRAALTRNRGVQALFLPAVSERGRPEFA